MKISESRDLFPFLKSGSIYMNHAAISPLSQLVLNKINDYLNIRSGSQAEDFNDLMRTASDTKDKLGKLINCEPSRIAFVDNTSNGLNILAQGLDWKLGDRIILNDIEFPSNVYPFLNLKEYGVEIDIVKSNEGVVNTNDIEKLITPQTRLVSISYVQFLSGYRIDLEKLGEVCRKHNIIFCVDAIQALGAIRLDVKKCNIDFLASGAQKWLMALEGTGFIYLTEELQNKISPKYVGWTSVSDAWNLLDYHLTLRRTAARFQNGTLSSIGIYALNASLSLMLELGLDSIEDTILDNTGYFLSALRKSGFNTVLTVSTRENLSGIISYKPEKSGEVFETLKKNDIHAALREGVIRFSPHFYNTKEEIDRVMAVLKQI